MLENPTVTAVVQMLLIVGTVIAVVAGAIGAGFYYLSKNKLDTRQRYGVLGCLGSGSILLGYGMPLGGVSVIIRGPKLMELGALLGLVGGAIYLSGLTTALWFQRR